MKRELSMVDHGLIPELKAGNKMEEIDILHNLTNDYNMVSVPIESILPIGRCGYTLSSDGKVIGIKILSVKQRDVENIMHFSHLQRLVLSDWDKEIEVPSQISELKYIRFLWIMGARTIPASIIDMGLPIYAGKDSDIVADTGNMNQLNLILSEFQLRKDKKNFRKNRDIRSSKQMKISLEGAETPEDNLDEESLLRQHISENKDWADRSRNVKGIYFPGIDSLIDPPPEIMEKGLAALRIYFHGREADELPLNEVKVILVGDGGAGKTSLVRRLLGEKFNHNERQTHGINIRSLSSRDPELGTVHLHLWDFGGQDIMHATHQFFLSKRSLYIVLLDGRKEEDAEYWLQHIESFGGDSQILVVINKIDQNYSYDVNRKFLVEKYKGIYGFFRISCSTDECLDFLNRAIEDSLKSTSILTTRWPKSWFYVKERLQSISSDYISLEQFQIICHEEGVKDAESQDILVEFLHDLGVIVHFRDFKLLDTHVLDPMWVTEGVYRIINSKELSLKKGVLSMKDIHLILSRKIKGGKIYPQNKYVYLIELMLKFELCYRISDENILIPDLLDIQEPEFNIDLRERLSFIIQYEYFPKSIIPRFIVRMNKDIFGDYRWRTGVVLHSSLFSAYAVVKADEKAKKIFIYVIGEQKRDYFSAIRNVLSEIHKTFEKLIITEYVPLPDNNEVVVEYRELVGYEISGVKEIFIGKLRKHYNVVGLLSGLFTEEKRKEEAMSMTIKVGGDFIADGFMGTKISNSQNDVKIQNKVRKMSEKSLAVVLAFTFGVVFLASMIILAVTIPNPTSTQFEIFRIVMALAAGGIAAVVPGMLNVKLSKGKGFLIRASGALAVFVIVYFFSPARWV